MANITGKDDGDDFKRDETLGALIRRDMHNDDAKYDPKPVKEDEEEKLFGKVVKKILKTKLPIWLIVGCLIAFSFFRLYIYITRDEPVNLRPAITNAKDVRIIITVCDEEAKAKDINVHDEAKRLENKLKDDEKVEDANVAIIKQKCD